MARRTRILGEQAARRLSIVYAWVRGGRVGIHVKFPDGSVLAYVYDRVVEEPTKPMRPSRRLSRDNVRPSVRWAVLERDGFACSYCGAKAPDARLVVDHITPVALGGSNEETNLTAACEPCNSGKAAKAIGGQLGGQLPREERLESGSTHETAA